MTFLLSFSDINSVLLESQERIQNVIGGVQNTINNVSKKDIHQELDIKMLGYLEYRSQLVYVLASRLHLMGE